MVSPQLTSDSETDYASDYVLKREDMDGNEIETVTSDREDKLRMADVNDWVTFVHEAVARWSASPYNAKYFQICNEHRSESG